MKVPKRVNFQENSRQPLTPPTLILENHTAFFFRKALFKALYKGPKSAIYFFGLKMKMKKGGAFWNFSENSSVLVKPPLPKDCYQSS